MPFRAHFDCLWCGREHRTRQQDDLEGWASLCPDCLGRADENGFLRARLRTALRERAEAARPPTDASSTTAEHDDWYLRRGRFSAGPLVDQPWLMELDDATRWLDASPLGGVIVELGAGAGWWSPLLAGKGELWLYEAHGASLEAARRRLVAHGLLAHLHERDPLAPPDRQVDGVFAAHLLAAARDEAGLRLRLERVREWLKPDAAFAFVEVAPTGPRSSPAGAPVEGPAGPLWPRDTETLRMALRDAGLAAEQLQATGRSFVLGLARRSP